MKRVFILLILCVSTTLLFSQTAKEIFSSHQVPVTYLGIDFSQARLIGDAVTDPDEIKEKHFYAINHLIVNEKEKYNIQKVFRRDSLAMDISLTDEHNKKVDENKIISKDENDFNRLDYKTIAEIVKSYDFGNRKGIGLMFIMEGMNKYVPRASMYIVFINMQTKKIVFSDRMMGLAKGFGFRNYWGRSVYEILEDIKSVRYDVWVRKTNG